MLLARGANILSYGGRLVKETHHTRPFSSMIPGPKLFDYTTIRRHIKPTKSTVEAIESAFGMLSKGMVDVPIPMHIGIPESEVHIFPL